MVGNGGVHDAAAALRHVTFDATITWSFRQTYRRWHATAAVDVAFHAPLSKEGRTFFRGGHAVRIVTRNAAQLAFAAARLKTPACIHLLHCADELVSDSLVIGADEVGDEAIQWQSGPEIEFRSPPHQDARVALKMAL